MAVSKNMPATRIKLTDTAARDAEPKASRYALFDDRVRGFALRVFPSGQKTWIFEYKGLEGGRKASTKRVTIGKFPDYKAREARELAELMHMQVRTGQDPQLQKIENRKAATVAEVAELFLAEHVGVKRKAGTIANYTDILNRIVVPAFGKEKAKTLARSEVARLHFKSRSTPFQANRILAVIGSMYSFASKTGLVPEGMNPARGIERYDEESRERVLSVEELERLGAAIREAETVGLPWQINPEGKTKHVAKTNRQSVIGPHTAGALRLLIFTGARLREILHLKWAWVDFDRGLLLLPTSKTGKKTIVLNAPALAVLNSLPRVGAYVIAGENAGTEREKPRSDLKRPWAVVKTLAGLEGLRIHDLRHNFASFGAGGGMGLPIIGRLLGHSQASTTQKYAHLDADPLRRASNAIASSIAAAMGEGSPTGEVIPMPRKQKSTNPQG